MLTSKLDDPSQFFRWQPYVDNPKLMTIQDLCSEKSQFCRQQIFSRTFVNNSQDVAAELQRLYQCWWRMLKMKCVSDNFEMLVTDSKCYWYYIEKVANITILSPTSYQTVFSLGLFFYWQTLSAESFLLQTCYMSTNLNLIFVNDYVKIWYLTSKKRNEPDQEPQESPEED